MVRLLRCCAVQREWSPEDLIASWTLIDSDWELIGNKTGATRVGFALMLKFFELEARFPGDAAEFPSAAVSYVAEQVKVDPAEISDYDWGGRAIERHRMQIRGRVKIRNSNTPGWPRPRSGSVWVSRGEPPWISRRSSAEAR